MIFAVSRRPNNGVCIYAEERLAAETECDTLDFGNFCIIQNIRRVGANWVTMGADGAGNVYSSYSDRLDDPKFHINSKVMVGSVANASAFKNSFVNSVTSNSPADFNIWEAHYLSFFDANSTNRNFQSSSGTPDYHVVVGNGADSVNTNNVSHSGYYHANLKFENF